MHDEILNALAARNGHFKFESGHHGNLWLDLDQLLLQAAPVRRFAAALSQTLGKYHLAAVCGPLVGGALIAQSIAAELGVEFYYSERTVQPQGDTLYSARYGIPQGLRERICGKDVGVVDDVINAGSAVRATIADIEACGARPVAVGALLVLGAAAEPFFRERNLPIESLLHLPGELWAPGECPLCGAGVPLESPAHAGSMAGQRPITAGNASESA